MRQFKAKTVYECWIIARDVAENYQKLANTASDINQYYILISARNVADSIALRIKNGDKNAG